MVRHQLPLHRSRARPRTDLPLASDKPFAEFAEATRAGIPAKPVLLGPLTFLLLGKIARWRLDRLALLDRLLPVYVEIIAGLAASRRDWIQIDEPVFVTDLSADELRALRSRLRRDRAGPRAMPRSSSRPSSVTSARPTRADRRLPVDGIGLDFMRGARKPRPHRATRLPGDKTLAAGVVTAATSGPTIWTRRCACSNDRRDGQPGTADGLDLLLAHARAATMSALEDGLDPESAPWLAFAEQKLAEVVTLATGA